ncbi:MAG: SCO family protein [Pikeienuella sp.]
MSLGRRSLTYAAAIFTALVLTLFVGWWRVDGPGASSISTSLPLPLTQMEFKLTNQDDNPVDPTTLLGAPSMVFFGFTNCPDVCPTTLADITGWLEDLAGDAAGMNVVFITVDPERDTVAAMAKYISYFHPAIQGWTGSPKQTARAAAAFRAKYEKVQIGEDDYSMNHTSSVFLFNANGRFTTAIDYHEPREFAVPKIRRALELHDGSGG